MRAKMIFCVALLLITFLHNGNCWTTEDLELFDLVESTPQNFYDVLGVHEKASSSDIRKAYRKLSTLYHPDKNKQSNAEETFRRIAAVADVLRNDERRKTYDLILKTGLPDWRVPIYYYRRVRNMGLLELGIFLLGFATLAQYLFAWSAYWERKYEIEEVVLSRIRKKAKNQRKGGKFSKVEEDITVSEAISTLQKPRCEDLFLIRLFCFSIHIIKSSPSYIASCRNYLKHRNTHQVKEQEEEEPQEIRIRYRKPAKAKVPDYSNITTYDDTLSDTSVVQNGVHEEEPDIKVKWSWDTLSEHQILEFKKAIKKFPNGTLQRWEKVATYLGCSVSEVISMVKQLKNQQFSKGIPLSMQGVTGTEKENSGCELYEEKGAKLEEMIKSSSITVDKSEAIENVSKQNGTVTSNGHGVHPEKLWTQEQQQALELALLKFPKDTSGRWDKIANFVSTKTKEECIERFKLLAQQVKKKKDKPVGHH